MRILPTALLLLALTSHNALCDESAPVSEDSSPWDPRLAAPFLKMELLDHRGAVRSDQSTASANEGPVMIGVANPAAIYCLEMGARFCSTIESLQRKA